MKIFSFLFILFSIIFSAVSVNAQTCLTFADKNCDQEVNISEVTEYINIWYRCSSCVPDIGDAMNAYFGIYDVCMPVPGCTSPGGFCDDNLPYTCTINPDDGCLDREDGDECDPGYYCDSGACIELGTPPEDYFYVDNNASGCLLGSTDYNPSTRKCGEGSYNVFFTIQECADDVQAGQTCLVYPGVYEERVIISAFGLESAKITFKPASRRSVLMKGFQIYDQEYIRIEGFNITNDFTGWDKVQGILLTRDNYIEIIDNYFYDLEHYAALQSWQPSDNVIVKDNYFKRVNAGIWANGDNWLIENNEVNKLIGCKTCGGTDADYARLFGSNITFRGNYFHGTVLNGSGLSDICDDNWEGPDFDPDHCSHVDSAQGFGDNSLSGDIVFENNVFQDFHQGIYLTGKQPDTILRVVNNILTDGGWCIVAASIPDIKIFNNVIDCGTYGVMFSNGNCSGTVQNNIITQL